MKKLLLFAVLLFAVSASCKEIPSPFWYSLSERILAGTNQFISTEHNSAKAVITLKVKPAKIESSITTKLKCQPKENIQFTPFVIITSDGMWIKSE